MFKNSSCTGKGSSSSSTHSRSTRDNRPLGPRPHTGTIPTATTSSIPSHVRGQMRSSGRSSGSSGYHADSERSSAYSEGDAYSLSSSNCGRSAPTLQPPRMADARNYIGRDSSTDSREYGSGKKRGTGGSASSDYEPFKPWTPGMEKHYGEYKDNAKAGGEYHTEYHSKQVSTNDRDRDPSFHQESSSKASQWGQAKQQESTGRRLMNDAVPSAYSSKTSRQTHQDEAESSLRSAQNARDRVGYHRNQENQYYLQDQARGYVTTPPRKSSSSSHMSGGLSGMFRGSSD